MLSFQIVTHCVPVTVCPAVGAVMNTPNVPPPPWLLTVTLRLAVAEAPAASVTVSPSVCEPAVKPVVSQL